MRESIPLLNIGGTRIARIGSTPCFMQDVSIGREFAADGRLYQLMMSQTKFSAVQMLSRFRKDGKWYMRMDEKSAKLLDPNMPLADTCQIQIILDATQKVEALDIIYRGRDERAPAPNVSKIARA